MKRVTSAWIVGVVFASIAVGACNRTPAEQDTARTPAAGPASAAVDDASITTSVQASYYADEAVRARHIDVSTENGVVTLRGTVDNDAAKQQAVNLARSVDGVSRVDDQLQVATQTGTTAAAEGPRARDQAESTGTSGRDPDGNVMPAWITTKIQAQYFASPEIKPWNIDVTTQSGGVVMLSGEVDTSEDKAEAVRIARATDGVTSVDDRLRVKGQPGEPAGTASPAGAEAGVDRPDAWLTAKIQSKYFLDDVVKMSDIDVDTQDGVVTLKGNVTSERERRQALALARNTDGVKSVTDQLQLQPETPESTGTPTAKIPPVEPVVDDTWITTKIQSKFFLDQSVKGHQINVDTRKGVVTLKGNVETDQQKQEAERIASETDGVSKVINNLVVGQR